MPWRQDRSGTLLRHSFAHALRSLSVSRAMQLATFMLVLVYQARHSSSPRQEHRFRTHASLTLNARVKANWATLSPNRGCVGPTCASAPGVDTLLPQRERAQTIRPLQVSQHVCCLLRPSRSAWTQTQAQETVSYHKTGTIAGLSPNSLTQATAGFACHGLRVSVWLSMLARVCHRPEHPRNPQELSEAGCSFVTSARSPK